MGHLFIPIIGFDINGLGRLRPRSRRGRPLLLQMIFFLSPSTASISRRAAPVLRATATFRRYLPFATLHPGIF